MPDNDGPGGNPDLPRDEGLHSQDNPDEARRALEARMLAASFGEIVTLFMRSPGHKHYNLADLEWLVLPAVLANQFAVAGAKSKDNAALTVPVGVALWARVSEEVDKEIASNLDRPLRLRPDQWTSGDILWLVDVVGVQDVGRALIGELSRTVFAGRTFKVRITDSDGKRTVKSVQGAGGVGSGDGAEPGDSKTVSGLDASSAGKDSAVN